MRCGYCNTENPDYALRCQHCRQPTPAGVASGLPALTEQEVRGVLSSREPCVRRNGATLIVPRGVALPSLCVRCGSPTTRTLRKKYTWHHPRLYALLFIHWLYYLLAAADRSKRFPIDVPLCDRHHSSLYRNRKIAEALLACWLVGSVLAYTIGGTLVRSQAVLLGAGILLGLAAVFAARSNPPLSPTFVDGNVAHFTGASEGFLSQLPRDILPDQ